MTAPPIPSDLVFRADSGNFDRFLASIGLLLVVASLGIPYFFFGSTDLLLIPQSEIEGLTQTSGEVIEGRQDAIQTLEPFVIIGSAVLAAVGIALLILGALGLKKAQESEDAVARLTKKRADIEFRTMSDEERKEGQEEKAAEAQVEELEQSGMDRVASTKEPSSSGAPSPSAESVVQAFATRQREQVAVIRRVEAQLDEVFAGRDLATHEFKSHLRIGTKSQSLAVDGLFEARSDDDRNVVLSLITATTSSASKRNARNRADELIASLSRYTALTGYRAVGWLVIVVPTERNDDFTATDLEVLRRVHNAALMVFGRAAVVRESEMDSLPDRFLDAFSGSSR